LLIFHKQDRLDSRYFYNKRAQPYKSFLSLALPYKTVLKRKYSFRHFKENHLNINSFFYSLQSESSKKYQIDPETMHKVPPKIVRPTASRYLMHFQTMLRTVL